MAAPTTSVVAVSLLLLFVAVCQAKRSVFHEKKCKHPLPLETLQEKYSVPESFRFVRTVKHGKPENGSGKINICLLIVTTDKLEKPAVSDKTIGRPLTIFCVHEDKEDAEAVCRCDNDEPVKSACTPKNLDGEKLPKHWKAHFGSPIVPESDLQSNTLLQSPVDDLQITRVWSGCLLEQHNWKPENVNTITRLLGEFYTVFDAVSQVLRFLTSFARPFVDLFEPERSKEAFYMGDMDKIFPQASYFEYQEVIDNFRWEVQQSRTDPVLPIFLKNNWCVGALVTNLVTYSDSRGSVIQHLQQELNTGLRFYSKWLTLKTALKEDELEKEKEALKAQMKAKEHVQAWLAVFDEYPALWQVMSEATPSDIRGMFPFSSFFQTARMAPFQKILKIPDLLKNLVANVKSAAPNYIEELRNFWEGAKLNALEQGRLGETDPEYIETVEDELAKEQPDFDEIAKASSHINIPGVASKVDEAVNNILELRRMLAELEEAYSGYTAMATAINKHVDRSLELLGF